MDAERHDPKVVLITGTSTGIGLFTAIELARRGERVFASMRDLSKAGALHVAASEAGVDVEVVALDVTSDASVAQAVAHVDAVAGRIDVVVNNAAVFVHAPVELTPLATVQTLVDTNIVGAIRVIQAVLPIMRRQGTGRIVNVGSVSAEPRIGLRLMGTYGATKAALHALSIDLNKELAPLGILVVLCEGGVGGRSAMLGPLVDGAAAFGQADGAYARAESTGRALAEWYVANVDTPLASAQVIADACTVPHPGVRHPLEEQATIDAAHGITDEDYLRLCAYDEIPTIADRYGPGGAFWLLG